MSEHTRLGLVCAVVTAVGWTVGGYAGVAIEMPGDIIAKGFLELAAGAVFAAV